jgi:hypothetical protein
MPRYLFLVTNWNPFDRNSEVLLKHYRARGTFEDRLREFNQAIGIHLSSQTFEENECTILMALLAFNPANIVRNEHEDIHGSCMDLGHLSEPGTQGGAILVKHSGRLVIRTAQSVKMFWERLVARLASWKLPLRWQANQAPNRGRLRPPPRHSHQSEVLQV